MEIVRIEPAPEGKDTLLTLRLDPQAAQRLVDAVKNGALPNVVIEAVRILAAEPKWTKGEHDRRHEKGDDTRGH